MASSSIEVMGGGEVKVMLINDSVGDNGEVDEELQTIITASADDNGDMVASVESAQESVNHEEGFDLEDEFTTLESMEPPPGTIIFSPQDLIRPSKPSLRGRGRGFLRPGGLASIKQEPHAPPTYGSSGDMEVPVSCEVCGKVMMTAKTLVQHMATHSDMKPFQCPHCPKSFARKVHLQGHLVVHGIEKQFECPVCHQRFSRQDCVKVHMRLHDKSKCVYCDVCHKAFLTVGALNIHLRIHRGEKPFKCHLCSKCFTQKNHLITHIKRHTKVTDYHFTKKLGPRMFQCEHCPRSFIRLSDYERHVQWNHGAVAEGSIVDKLPTVGNLLDGELKQTGLAPQIFKAPRDALNSRPRVRRSKKVMCTTSTQTDEDGGRIIVPRKYQVCAATQVSAPPTPRREEDMYENDIFDEGMDRNYSSDDDEEEGDGDGEGGSDSLGQKVYALPHTAEMASDPIQDAAFDAIVQGKEAPRTQQRPPQDPPPQATSQAPPEQDKHSEFLEEVVNSMVRQAVLPETSDDGEAEQRDDPEERSDPDDLPEVRVVPGALQVVGPLKDVVKGVASRAKEGPVKVKKEPVGVLPIPLLYPPKRGKGRGRSRSKKFSPYGLSGAAELLAIRMNMMKNMMNSEAKEGEDGEEDEPPEQEVVAAAAAQPLAAAVVQAAVTGGGSVMEEVETEGRGKRLAKNKQHGKDFVCNMKSCETCCPPQPRPARPATATQATPQRVKVKVKQESPRKVPLGTPRPVSTISATTSQEDSIHGLLSLSQGHLLKSVKQEVISAGRSAGQAEEAKMKVGNRVGSYPVDITANPLAPGKREDYFVTSSSGEMSVVSPPVELMSFCIPTYSCKLCSREFRFEGKLHRHIESVHQNKVIFSPDVKPGRGSTNVKDGPTPTYTHQFMASAPAQPAAPQQDSDNPEIAALRSEWDDDEDDDPDPKSQGAVGTAAAAAAVSGSHAPITIVTRDIAPVTTTVTDAYSGGVKVNMNKLAGLLSQAGKAIPVARGTYRHEGGAAHDGSGSSSAAAAPQEPETIMADTLDMKCRRLLEKLFDQDLLLQCGLLEEHVSVVLGKVLQHYGVKMIEDYGQGQYEVLKYNLWRLIEWKVTMEQMEEFYTEGKSVEEMMDDIMHERVPVVSHHFVPHSQAAAPPPPATTAATAVTSQGQPQTPTHVETVDIPEGQVVLQHVAGVLGGQISLPEGVTQVVLSQDMTPDLLQGAHIVTIDPTTGQVISQVTADQVILADAIGDDLEQQVSALDGGVVVSQGGLSGVPQGTIVATHPGGMTLQPGQVLVQETAGSTHHQVVKMEAVTTTTTTTAPQHHHH